MGKSRAQRSIKTTWYPIAIVGVVAIAAGALAIAALSPRSVADATVPHQGPYDWQTSGPTEAAFIGDSYTHGTGASDDAHRWTTLVSAAEGWQEVNLGRGGTGYIATASTAGCGKAYCPSYDEMVPNAKAAEPDVVVIAGGQNDYTAWAADPAAVTERINKTYTDVKAAIPSAQIIAVGPSTPGPIDEIVISMDQAVQAAAASVGAQYISLIDPPVIDSSMLTEDRGHVVDVGHQAIAQRVIDSLG